MPPVVIEQAMQVAVSGLNQGTPWTNVYGVKTPTNFPLDQTSADLIAGHFRTLYTSLAAKCSSGWTATECIIYDLRSGTAPSWQGVFATVTGSNAGNAMPPGVAACVTHRTGLRGRRFNGRTYLSGLTENANDSNGVINATDRTNIATYFATLRTNLATLGEPPMTQGVISRAGGVITAVTSSFVDAEWDHQDRRKRA